MDQTHSTGGSRGGSATTRLSLPAEISPVRGSKATVSKYYDITSSILQRETTGDVEELFINLARDGAFERLQNLLSRHGDILVSIDHKDRRTGNTALIWAAKRGHIKVTQLLLKHGADITLRNYDGKSALEIASSVIKQMMLDHIEQSSNSPQRLLEAAWVGNQNVIEAILMSSSRGFDINCHNSDGFTPILLCARDVYMFENFGRQLIRDYNPLGVMAQLINYRADLSACDSEGKTALHYCASSKASISGSLTRLLVQHSPPELRDRRNLSPLHCAVQASNLDSIEILLQSGADVNAQGFAGFTPLHIAVSSNLDVAASLLLENGADPKQTDDDHKSPLDIARTRKMKTLLRSWLEPTSERLVELGPVRGPATPRTAQQRQGSAGRHAGRVTPTNILQRVLGAQPDPQANSRDNVRPLGAPRTHHRSGSREALRPITSNQKAPRGRKKTGAASPSPRKPVQLRSHSTSEVPDEERTQLQALGLEPEARADGVISVEVLGLSSADAHGRRKSAELFYERPTSSHHQFLINSHVPPLLPASPIRLTPLTRLNHSGSDSPLLSTIQEDDSLRSVMADERRLKNRHLSTSDEYETPRIQEEKPSTSIFKSEFVLEESRTEEFKTIPAANISKGKVDSTTLPIPHQTSVHKANEDTNAKHAAAQRLKTISHDNASHRHQHPTQEIPHTVANTIMKHTSVTPHVQETLRRAVQEANQIAQDATNQVKHHNQGKITMHHSDLLSQEDKNNTNVIASNIAMTGDTDSRIMPLPINAPSTKPEAAQSKSVKVISNTVSSTQKLLSRQQKTNLGITRLASRSSTSTNTDFSKTALTTSTSNSTKKSQMNTGFTKLSSNPSTDSTKTSTTNNKLAMSRSATNLGQSRTTPNKRPTTQRNSTLNRSAPNKNAGSQTLGHRLGGNPAPNYAKSVTTLRKTVNSKDNSSRFKTDAGNVASDSVKSAGNSSKPILRRSLSSKSNSKTSFADAVTDSSDTSTTVSTMPTPRDLTTEPETLIQAHDASNSQQLTESKTVPVDKPSSSDFIVNGFTRKSDVLKIGLPETETIEKTSKPVKNLEYHSDIPITEQNLNSQDTVLNQAKPAKQTRLEPFALSKTYQPLHMLYTSNKAHTVPENMTSPPSDNENTIPQQTDNTPEMDAAFQLTISERETQERLSERVEYNGPVIEDLYANYPRPLYEFAAIVAHDLATKKVAPKKKKKKIMLKTPSDSRSNSGVKSKPTKGVQVADQSKRVRSAKNSKKSKKSQEAGCEPILEEDKALDSNKAIISGPGWHIETERTQIEFDDGGATTGEESDGEGLSSRSKRSYDKMSPRQKMEELKNLLLLVRNPQMATPSSATSSLIPETMQAIQEFVNAVPNEQEFNRLFGLDSSGHGGATSSRSEKLPTHAEHPGPEHDTLEREVSIPDVSEIDLAGTNSDYEQPDLLTKEQLDKPAVDLAAEEQTGDGVKNESQLELPHFEKNGLTAREDRCVSTAMTDIIDEILMTPRANSPVRHQLSPRKRLPDSLVREIHDEWEKASHSQSSNEHHSYTSSGTNQSTSYYTTSSSSYKSETSQSSLNQTAATRDSTSESSSEESESEHNSSSEEEETDKDEGAEMEKHRDKKSEMLIPRRSAASPAPQGKPPVSRESLKKVSNRSNSHKTNSQGSHPSASIRKGGMSFSEVGSIPIVLPNGEINEEFLTSSLKSEIRSRPNSRMFTSRLGARRSSIISDQGNTTHRSIDSEVSANILKWKKGNLLGKGAYGKVYCGLTLDGHLIAVKQITLSAHDWEKAEKEYESIQEEVELLKTLNHDNIVGFLGTSLEDHVVSIFMQFVPGGTIASLLSRFGAFEERVFQRYTLQIVTGVQYLHENGVIHRDIKGANIMLMSNGVIKLIDFGCAKRLCLNLSVSQSEILKSMKGTPYWMAPEVIQETGHGYKSDVWSIGCTVFEMATTGPPWSDMQPMAAIFAIGSDKPVPTLFNTCSADALDFTTACLQRDQNNRPSAQELLQHPFLSSVIIEG